MAGVLIARPFPSGACDGEVNCDDAELNDDEAEKEEERDALFLVASTVASTAAEYTDHDVGLAVSSTSCSTWNSGSTEAQQEAAEREPQQKTLAPESAT